MSRFSTGVLLAALVLFTPACSGTENGTASTETETTDPGRRLTRVETTRMTTESFREIIQVTGAVDTANDVQLSARTAGTVEMLAESGASVKEGDVIARFDTRLVRAALDQATAMLESAESRAALAEDTFRRQQALYRDSIISALEFENVRAEQNQANAALNQARATVDQAREQVEYGTIKAPFGGTVEERFVETGEQVSPGTPVIRIVNTRSLKVRAGIPERYASDIRAGTPVEIRFKTYGAEPRTGRISFVGNVIHPQNRTFTVEVDLSNPDGVLKPEMIADLYITRRVLKDQMVLPQNAILRDEEGYSVYVVDDSGVNDTVVRRRIEPGPTYNGRTVISSGLEPGEQVVISGQSTVTEGDPVEIA